MTVVLDVVSVLATIALMVLLLGPAPDVLRIHKAQATGVTPVMPLVALHLNGWIWTIYGYLDHNIFPLVVCNFVGVVLGLIYTVVFCRWTHERVYTVKVVSVFAAAVVLALVYAFVGGFGFTGQSRESVRDVFGYVGVVTVFIFFASPFENIGKVLRHRSGVFIPILMVVAGAVNAALWVVYSLLDINWFIFVPNAGAFVLSSIQIALYVKFDPRKHPFVKETAVSNTHAAPKDLEAGGSPTGAAAVGDTTSESGRFVALESPRLPSPTIRA